MFLSAALLSVFPCVLLISYTQCPHPTRFLFQTLILIPVLFITSVFVTIIGGLIKYLSFNFISTPYRIYILQELYASFGHVEWFIFEHWTKLRYVISTDDDIEDIYNLNMILLGNHSESLFDFIPLGTISDYFNRVSKSFVFIKKEMLWFPIMGWVEAVCPHGVSLNRNWDKDKVLIANLCDKFNKNIDYKYTNPWMWFMFPEGTRFNKKKLDKAQQFAIQRGYTSLNNLLQPKVKGFSYLTYHLHQSLGCILDATILYKDKPPTPYHVLVNTRFCKYIHVHLRVYKNDKNDDKNDKIPNDIKKLQQWLRDRWTEKDEILQDMKDGKIKYKMMKNREPWNGMKYYAFYAILSKYLVFNLLFGLPFWSTFSFIMLICFMFPIFIVLIEYTQKQSM